MKKRIIVSAVVAGVIINSALVYADVDNNSDAIAEEVEVFEQNSEPVNEAEKDFSEEDTENNQSEYNEQSDAVAENNDDSEPKKTYSEQSELIYSESSAISFGLEYTRNIYNSIYGTQREYLLEYTPSEETRLDFVGNTYLYQASVIDEMVENQLPEENFVAGINGDFFNMSTGVPESAFIKDYELYTTDRDSYCLAYNDLGEYFFDKPSVKITLTAEDNNAINIAHLNKEFSEYALYLYNSRYSQTTHIKNSYSSALLLPYDNVYTEEQIRELAEDDETLAQIFNNNSYETDDEFISVVEEATYTKYIAGNYYEITGIFPSVGYSEKLVVYQVDTDCKNGEIPQNGYLLCGDNSSYGYIPASMNPGDTFILEVNGNERFENVINAIGVGAILVNDSEIVKNTGIEHYKSLQPRSAVGIKEDGSLLFYAADGRRKNSSEGIKLDDLAEIMKNLGCVYAANLDGGGSTVVKASRPGFDNASTMNTPSAGKERNISNAFVFTNNLEKTNIPHAVHVYADSIVTYHDWLVEIPEPVISDTNGFSYSTEEKENEISGETSFNDINTDENETEAATSDEQGPDDTINEISAEEQLPVLPEIEFFTNDGTSTVLDGVLYPSGVKGRIDVFASIDGEEAENAAFSVYTVENPDKISLNVEKKEFAPYEDINLSISASYKNVDIISGHESYVWSVKEESEEYATGLYGSVDSGKFIPSKLGTTFTVTASRGDAFDSVDIFVDDYPFSDIENHWAVKEIYSLAKKGVVAGYPTENEDEFLYLPQRNYSRYEFCVMLARMTGIGADIKIPEVITSEENEDETETPLTDVETEPLADEGISENEDSFEDIEQDDGITDFPVMDFCDAVSIPDWAYESVYRLYVSGLLDGIMQINEQGETVFNGAEFITRADVMSVIGKICEAAPDDYDISVFTDLTDEYLEDEYIKNCIYSGIFSGYEDMTIKPENLLTRAEAAAVFVRLEKHLDENNI